MIRPISELHHKKPTLDLTGPQGNAFVLIGMVKQYGHQLGWEEEEIKTIQDEMMSGDYENLVTIFDKHFGELVDIYR